jgi:PAS domain S-box-containing protein
MEEKNKIESIPEFDKLVDDIFEKQEIRNKIFDNDQMLYAALDYSGKFKYMSKSWSACLGFSEEEFKAVPFSVFLHPDDIAESMDAYKFFSVKGKPAIKMFANRYRKRNGEYAMIQWFESIYSKELKLWLFTAFEIPIGHQGINVYNEDYKPFKWKESEK